MHRGYVKLWRKSCESAIWKNHDLFRFWVWCLMKASHRQSEILIGYRKFKIQPGQFIFGRKKSSKETGLSERTVRTCLQTLKSTNNLTIKTTNKFSIINIVNWETYQQTEIINDQQNDQQSDQLATSKRPASDHIQECIKHIKNDKKKDRESCNGVPDWIKKETWDDFKEFRIRIKAPLTERAIKGIIKELENLKSQGHDPDAVLEQSIVRGWRGVFPLKAQSNECPGFDWSKP